jgi:predicted transcriptional regulator YheO
VSHTILCKSVKRGLRVGEIHNNGVDLEFFIKKKTLSKHDKELLEAVKPIAKAVALVFGKNCEVVLHSLEDPTRSVILIENPTVTSRKEGSPLTNLGINALAKASESNVDVIDSYFTTTKTNKTLKSITALIKNGQGTPIGMFCINIDISAPFFSFAEDFIPDAVSVSPQTKEQFASDISEFIEANIQKEMAKLTRLKKFTVKERNQMVIAALLEKNVFNIKGAVEIVADGLGISKYTVYSYLRQVKQEQEEGLLIQ